MALCSGIAGLDLGLKLAVPGYRTVCHVERDSYAAAVLVARMADKALDLAPVWDDVATFRGEPWRGVVDLVSAGFPCQPWSSSGKRLGLADERWLWASIARVVGEVRPTLVFIENVPPLLRHGLRVVLSDLASLGFDAEWDLFRASDVRAPHLRERLYLLAYADEFRRADQRGGGLLNGKRASRRRHADGRCAAGDGSDSDVPRRTDDQGWPGPEAPSEGGQVARIGGRYGVELAEWPAEPAVGRVVDGLSAEVDELRCLGNAVVPRQAALAFLELSGRIRE